MPPKYDDAETPSALTFAVPVREKIKDSDSANAAITNNILEVLAILIISLILLLLYCIYCILHKNIFFVNRFWDFLQFIT